MDIQKISKETFENLGIMKVLLYQTLEEELRYPRPSPLIISLAIVYQRICFNFCPDWIAVLANGNPAYLEDVVERARFEKKIEKDYMN